MSSNLVTSISGCASGSRSLLLQRLDVLLRQHVVDGLVEHGAAADLAVDDRRRDLAAAEAGDVDLLGDLLVRRVEARLELLEGHLDGQLGPGRAQGLDGALHRCVSFDVSGLLGWSCGCVVRVGATGLEPAISCSQSRRASHYATPRQVAPNAVAAADPLERMTGIEPAYPVWKTGALPLSYIRAPFRLARCAPVSSCHTAPARLPTSSAGDSGPQRRCTSNSARSSPREPTASISRSGAALEAPLSSRSLWPSIRSMPLGCRGRGSRPCRRCRACTASPRSQPAADGGEVRALDEPERRALGPLCTTQRPEPATGAGRPAGGRRCGSRSRRSRGRWRCGRGREPLDPSPGGAGTRWRPAGTPRAAARRAGHRTRRSAAARGCRPPRPCRTRRRRRPRAASSRAGGPDDEVAGERGATGRAQRALGVEAGRQRREQPWLWIRSRRSTSIDSPLRAGDAEPGAPERGQQDDEAGGEDHRRRRPTVARGDVGLLGQTRAPTSSQHEHHEPRQVARAEDQAAQQHRQRPAASSGEVRPRRPDPEQRR